MANGSAAGSPSKLSIVLIVACFAAPLYLLCRVFAPFISVLIRTVVLPIVFSLSIFKNSRLQGNEGLSCVNLCSF